MTDFDRPSNGVGASWVRNAVIGVLLSFSIFLLGSSLNFSLADLLINLVYPGLLAVNDEFLVIVVLAGAVEEPVFRGLAPIWFSQAFLHFGSSAEQSFFLGERAANVAFSLFHFVAYGVAAAAAFFGAYVFGEVAMVINKSTGGMASNVAFHMATNAQIIGAKFVVVGQ